MVWTKCIRVWTADQDVEVVLPDVSSSVTAGQGNKDGETRARCREARWSSTYSFGPVVSTAGCNKFRHIPARLHRGMLGDPWKWIHDLYEVREEPGLCQWKCVAAVPDIVKHEDTKWRPDLIHMLSETRQPRWHSAVEEDAMYFWKVLQVLHRI